MAPLLRDYISDLKKLRYASRRRPIRRRPSGYGGTGRESRCSQHTCVCEHLSEVCNTAMGT